MPSCVNPSWPVFWNCSYRKLLVVFVPTARYADVALKLGLPSKINSNAASPDTAPKLKGTRVEPFKVTALLRRVTGIRPLVPSAVIAASYASKVAWTERQNSPPAHTSAATDRTAGPIKRFPAMEEGGPRLAPRDSAAKLDASRSTTP